MIRYYPHPIAMLMFLVCILTAGFVLSPVHRVFASVVLLIIFLLHEKKGAIFKTFFKLVIPLSAAIGLFMTFVYPETEQWIIIFGIRTSREGLYAAAEMISRIMLLFTGIIAFFNLLSMPRLGSYLYQLNLPVWLVFMLINGLKFVTRFRDTLDEIHFYQRLRGLPLERFHQRWRATLKLLIPLLYVMIEESTNRAIALEMRGFTETQKRTTLAPDNLNLADGLLTIVLATGTLLLIMTLFI
jgi:energy-coupling factor transport system permease protein